MDPDSEAAEDGSQQRMARRRALKRGAVVGGAVAGGAFLWVTPAMQTIAIDPSHAQTASGQGESARGKATAAPVDGG